MVEIPSALLVFWGILTAILVYAVIHLQGKLEDAMSTLSLEGSARGRLKEALERHEYFKALASIRRGPPDMLPLDREGIKLLQRSVSETVAKVYARVVQNRQEDLTYEDLSLDWHRAVHDIINQTGLRLLLNEEAALQVWRYIWMYLHQKENKDACIDFLYEVVDRL